MRFNTLMQKGSKSRDHFKYLHKHMLGKDAWALDSDLELVEKSPLPFIVARLDFKMPHDRISFTEAIAYQTILKFGIPVYFIEAHSGFLESEPSAHRFDIYRLDSTDYRPKIPTRQGEYILRDATWDGLAVWEKALRRARQKEFAEELQRRLRSAAD